MDIGVVMLVKNEALRIEGALAPILDQFAQVIVLDTGSTDGTQDLLRERLRIEPMAAKLDHDQFGGYARLRNHGLAMLKTPWCLTLDADERLDPAGLRLLRKSRPAAGIGGIFLCWRNLVENADSFDDYKCILFRRGFNKVGLIHENVQPSLRRHGATAQWSDAVILEHHPEARKNAWKRETYRNLLLLAMKTEPTVPRYPWFAGYAALRENNLEEAEHWLSLAANSQHPHYPVERLNAQVALTAVSARCGNRAGTLTNHALAKKMFQDLRDDFEVRVNYWYEPWIDQAIDIIYSSELEQLSIPRFAC